MIPATQKMSADMPDRPRDEKGQTFHEARRKTQALHRPAEILLTAEEILPRVENYERKHRPQRFSKMR